MAKLLSAALLALLVFVACSEPVPTGVVTPSVTTQPKATTPADAQAAQPADSTGEPTIVTTAPLTEPPTMEPEPGTTTAPALTPEPAATATVEPTPTTAATPLPTSNQVPTSTPAPTQPPFPGHFGAELRSHQRIGARPTTQTTIDTRRQLNPRSSRHRAASTAPTRGHGSKASGRRILSTSSPAPKPTTAASAPPVRLPGPSSPPTC